MASEAEGKGVATDPLGLGLGEAVAAAGAVSAVMLVARPGARPMYDRLAGTRLVRVVRA